MDLYTTSFTLPRSTSSSSSSPRAPSSSPTAFAYPLPSSADGTSTLPSLTTSTSTRSSSLGHQGHAASSSSPDSEKEWASAQRLCEDVTAKSGCLVTVSREQVQKGRGRDRDRGRDQDLGSSLHQSEYEQEPLPSFSFNFHLSGTYQAVMSARGTILREVLRETRTALMVPCADVLESSQSTGPGVVKPEVKQRLEGIAMETGAILTLLGSETIGDRSGSRSRVIAVSVPPGHVDAEADMIRHPAASSEGRTSQKGSIDGLPLPMDERSGERTYGLETERMCEIAISGSLESVELAKVRVLVLLDELTGLYAEMCDIDYKLHAIIAGRRRAVIQQIQEETATNIYFPTPLVGTLDQPRPGHHGHGHGHGHGHRGVNGTFQGAPGHLTVQSTGMASVHSHMSGPNYPHSQPMSQGGSFQGGPQHSHQHQHLNPGNSGVFGGHSSQRGGPGPGPGPGQGPGPGTHYHPHQHVQYPYQSQPMGYHSHGHGRGMQFGPQIHHQHQHQPHLQHQNQHQHQHQHAYNGMNAPHSPMPMSMNHTGTTNMTGFHSNHQGMSSPIPPQHHHHHGHSHGHGHGGHGISAQGNNYFPHPPASPMPQHLNGGSYTPQGLNMGSGMGMAMGGGQGSQPHSPFPNNGMASGQGHGHGHGHGHGQNHVHVGLGIGGGGGGMMHNGHGSQTPNGAMMGGPHGNLGPGPGPVHVHAHGQFGMGPHPGLNVHGGEQGSMGRANQIWITGEFFGVQRARDMLLGMAMQKSRLVISRDTAILPRKLDWLLTEKLEDIKTVMSDNGTYMQVPAVGSQASLITVFGDHRVNIERTIRTIMTMACQFYVASFWLLPMAFDVLMPRPSLNPAQMQPILKQIAHSTGAELVFKSNCFEMHGLGMEVGAAVVAVLELDIISNFHHEIRFQIELANEHRDFIAGKKNGKINKIMKVAGVKIKFETYNDYNFLMDLSGSSVGSLQGLSLLQEELPAEASFHVPESYHKRIIGVQGKNIQRIMKLYGVYVKFSNAEEFAQLGGYGDNEDNVVARTPAKNSAGLESLKGSVMELVNPKDKDYTTETVSIPRRYHRTLLGEKSIFIHDIESKTNTIVRFPYKETASDIVSIFGPESQIPIAATMLLDLVPFEADLHVPPHAEVTTLVNSPEFVVFTERIKRDHQIAITTNSSMTSTAAMPAAPSVVGTNEETVFKFRCQRSNIEFLGTARDALEEWLKGHNVDIFPPHAKRRVDTFGDAFTHFNSKILATKPSIAGPKAGAVESEPLSLSRPRPNSVTDVKALFEAPGTAALPAGLGDEAVKGFAGPLSFDPTRRSDVWQAPHPPQVRSERSPASKRDSDPIIQDKLRSVSSGSASATTASSQIIPVHALHLAPTPAPAQIPIGSVETTLRGRGSSSRGGSSSGSGSGLFSGPGSKVQPLSHANRAGNSARTQSLDISSLNFARALAGPGSAAGSGAGAGSQGMLMSGGKGIRQMSAEAPEGVVRRETVTGPGAVGGRYGVDGIAQALSGTHLGQPPQ